MNFLIDRQTRSGLNLKAGMCDCYRCIRERGDIRMRIGSCSCGNKRCPKSSDHRFECTGSNEPGQEGSIYKG